LQEFASCWWRWRFDVLPALYQPDLGACMHPFDLRAGRERVCGPPDRRRNQGVSALGLDSVTGCHQDTMDGSAYASERPPDSLLLQLLLLLPFPPGEQRFTNFRLAGWCWCWCLSVTSPPVPM
jgi:hypothetical protein